MSYVTFKSVGDGGGHYAQYIMKDTIEAERQTPFLLVKSEPVEVTESGSRMGTC